jgi:deazaflavin-dependent oxidoreductase (nitroreductase family)
VFGVCKAKHLFRGGFGSLHRPGLGVRHERELVGQQFKAGGNKAPSWLYRLSGGRIGGSVAGVPVMLLTVPGRKTGVPHTAPVSRFEHDEGWLVVGSAAGSDQDPQWFRNLRAAGRARIVIGSAEHEVDVRIAEGRERDHLYREVVVMRGPHFAKYERRTTRVIPIAVLTPR